MPKVASVDYTAKRIYLSAETVGVDLDTLDIFKEVRALRRTDTEGRKFYPMIIADGNKPKQPLVFTAISIELLYGCRIVPFDTSHTLKLVRDTFTDDGFAGSGIFDRTPLSPTSMVDIDVDVKEVEVREVVVGSAVTAQDIVDIKNAVWDEPYSNHTIAGTFGKLMDIIRKSNLAIDGSITANPTLLSFDSDLTDPTGTHDHQTLLFVTGQNQGHSEIISGYTNGGRGTIVLEENLPYLPAVNDEFVILPYHSRTLEEFSDAIWNEVL